MEVKEQDNLDTSYSTRAVFETDAMKTLSSAAPTDKYRYYYKNFIVFGIVTITGFAALNSSANLLSTFAGKSLGFASLTIGSFMGFLVSFLVPAVTRSIGTQRSLVLSFLLMLIFVGGQFYVSYFTLIPAALFFGVGISMFWPCGAMYLGKLAVDYAVQCNKDHEKMISFANGYLMACYSAAILLGNAFSSSILLPSDLDEQSVAVGNGSCNLRQSTDHIDPYNVHLMVLRGVLLLNSVVAVVTMVFFVDKLKGEDSKLNLKMFLSEVKTSNIELLRSCLREKPYFLLGIPIVVTSALVQGYIFGNFPKDYISECVGVHIVGYATMVYGLTATVSGFVTGKVYLAYLPRYVVGILNCVMTLAFLTFLLIWKREPSYVFIFVFVAFWGITDGQWNTFAPSYVGHMLHKKLDVAYMAYALCFLTGYSIVFASGFIFDRRGVIWVMVVCVCASLPPYLMAEWLHKHFDYTSTYTKSTESIMEQTESTSIPDFFYLLVYRDKKQFILYETAI